MSETDRLRAIVGAGVALASELSLDAVLQKIVETAAELTGARYAALGVIDPSGQALERFVVTGIDEETQAAIGDVPRGRGILGALIQDAKPLRLENLAEDPRSVGFPPNHPPMRAFLGVPILLRGVAYGNLYLTEKADGAPFTAEDEELTTMLSSQAAVAIENARLYEAATRWLTQLESLNEIASALASEVELSRVLELVASRLRELVHARLVLIALPGSDGATLVVRASDGEGADEFLGIRLERDGSKTGKVLERRRSERVDSMIDDFEIDQDAGRRLAARTGLFVPMLLRDRAIGVISAHDKEGSDARFTEEDVRLAEAFASRAAVAVDLSERVASDALRRVVSAQELERQRLARELHDETGQALTSILLGLKAVEDAKDPSDLEAAAGQLQRARREHAPGRPPPRRRAAPEGARRLRPRAGHRAPRGDIPRAHGARGSSRAAARRGALAVRRRDDAVPHHAGSPDQCGQARPGEAREHRPHAAGRERRGRDRGRRPGPRERRRLERSRASRDARADRARRGAAGSGVVARLRHYALDRGADLVTIRVLVVDDHAVVRSGLRRVLEAEDDIEVVAEAGDLRDAVFEARAHKPDVILMDVVMPGASGIEATPAVLKEARDAKVLMLSMQDDPRYVREAFSAGASGYVLKEAVDAEVVDAVREVAGGGRYVHPVLGARLIQAEAEERAHAEEDPLSEREREVLRLLALGHTNQEIAKMLYLSVRTVETHRAHIMQKLRLTTRAELVRFAIDHGLLEEQAEPS